MVLVAISATPTEAGRWVNGGMFDPVRLVPVSFLRFLAEAGEGQMTIRCDEKGGLWVDAGVDGNGALPPGVTTGGGVDVTMTFIQAAGPVVVTMTGKALVRADGAVLATMEGATAAPLGPVLLEPAERVDISIAGTVRPVPLADVHADIVALADRCVAWPR